jgi:hypothetical protein
MKGDKMTAFTPTMDRDVERQEILKFLKQVKHNHIIQLAEIQDISNLNEKEWFRWAIEKLNIEDEKILTKVGQNFVITFSKKALDKFESTKETDWNEISDSEFETKFAQLDFETASIVMDGQFELFKILTINLSENLKNFKQNQILKNDFEEKLKLLNEAIEKWTGEIKNLSAELKVVSSRHDRMSQLIINK